MSKKAKAQAARKQRLQTKEKLERELFVAAMTMQLRQKDLAKWPDDPEHLHQYRISIRVARSLVKFLKPYQKPAAYEQLAASLKELQDPTSRMRELDVLVPSLDAAPELQELCRAAQLANREAFMEGFGQDETQDKLASVQDALEHFPWNKRALVQGIDANELAKNLQKRQERCESTLATLDFDDQDTVHELRKDAKAVRYVARELGRVLPEGAGELSTRMREVQDRLGEWCDARVNAALITEICGEQGIPVAKAFQEQAEHIMLALKEEQQKGQAAL